MKTFKQFLEESWHSSHKKWLSKDHFDVYKNPSKRELHKMLHSSEASSAKGIIHGKDVYVWDAMHAIHDHVNNSLGLERNRRNHISISKHKRYGSEYVGDGNISHITEHPWVKKTIPDYRFFHG